MALGDYVYRLKAEAGDSTAHDELAVSGDLSGGTITLVDDDGTGKAWQFAGIASVSTPSMVESVTTTGGGKTFAVRMAVTTYDSSSYAQLVAIRGATHNTYIGQNGANSLRARKDQTGPDTVTIGTVNTAYRTYVIRGVTAATPTTDKLHVWINTTSRGNTDPNVISTGATYSGNTYTSLALGSANSVIKITDFVAWDEELSNADCTALADDGIRATLDTAGAETSATITSASSTLTGSFIVSPLTTLSISASSDVSAATASVSPISSTAVDLNSDTISGTFYTGPTAYVNINADDSAISSFFFTSPLASVGINLSADNSSVSVFSSPLSSLILTTPDSTVAGGFTSSTVPTITTQPFKNNTGTVLSNLSIDKLAAIKLLDMTLAATWANQTTDANGVLSLGSQFLDTSTDYLLVAANTAGTAVGVAKYTTT